MKKRLVLVSLLLLAACTTMEPRQTNVSSEKRYTVTCHSIDGSTNDCLRAAKKVCVQGFSVLDKQSHKIEYASSGDGFYIPPKHELAIACNES